MKKIALAIVLALGFGTGFAPLTTLAAPTPQHRQHHPSGAVMQRLHAQLHLNPHQDAAWQKIRVDQKRLRQEFRAHRAAIRKAMAAELAKPQPNLNHVAAVQEQGQAQLRARGHAVRREMLAFYNGLSPQQKTVVRDFLRARFERAKAARQSAGRQ